MIILLNLSINLINFGDIDRTHSKGYYIRFLRVVLDYFFMPNNVFDKVGNKWVFFRLLRCFLHFLLGFLSGQCGFFCFFSLDLSGLKFSLSHEDFLDSCKDLCFWEILLIGGRLGWSHVLPHWRLPNWANLSFHWLAFHRLSIQSLSIYWLSLHWLSFHRLFLHGFPLHGWWLWSNLLWQGELRGQLLGWNYSDWLRYNSLLLRLLSPRLGNLSWLRFIFWQNSPLWYFSHHDSCEIWKLRFWQKREDRHNWADLGLLFRRNWLWLFLLFDDLLLGRIHWILFKNSI